MHIRDAHRGACSTKHSASRQPPPSDVLFQAASGWLPPSTRNERVNLQLCFLLLVCCWSAWAALNMQTNLRYGKSKIDVPWRSAILLIAFEVALKCFKATSMRCMGVYPLTDRTKYVFTPLLGIKNHHKRLQWPATAKSAQKHCKTQCFHRKGWLLGGWVPYT